MWHEARLLALLKTTNATITDSRSSSSLARLCIFSQSCWRAYVMNSITSSWHKSCCMVWPWGSFSRQPDLCLANTLGERDLAMGIITARTALGGLLLRIVLKNSLYSRILKFTSNIRIVGFALLILIAIACGIVNEHLPSHRGQ